MLPLHGQDTAAVKLYITGQKTPYIFIKKDKHKKKTILLKNKKKLIQKEKNWEKKPLQEQKSTKKNKSQPKKS